MANSATAVPAGHSELDPAALSGEPVVTIAAPACRRQAVEQSVPAPA
jgi:hypothetical protein